MNHAKKLIAGIAFSICFSFISNNAIAQTDYTVASGVIPPEFNHNNDTFLVFSRNPFYSMSMKKHFRKSYTGEYKLVSSLGDYPADRFRFVMYEMTSTTHITVIGSPNGAGSHDMVGTSGFYVLDRKTDTKYVCNLTPTPKNINKYIAALDGARQ